mmetsp:Transcript_27401/g.51147  ORF Transcript_27401/g.51147 Transcript_27401/m.51147 type:complete len:277 (-) Transcript_27401:16-846(-)
MSSNNPMAAPVPGRRAALILGWTDSKPYHLRRYERMWNTKGYTPVARATPLHELCIPERKGFPMAREVLRKVAALNPTELVMHVFSNGGGFNYLQVRAVLEEEQEFTTLRKVLRGVVFDSLPSLYVHPVALIMLSPRSDEPLPRKAVKLLWALGKNLRYLIQWPVKGNPWRFYLPSLLNTPTDVPELFLYADGDDLIPSASIEEYVNRRRRRGARCEGVNFGRNSAHVSHHKLNQKAYEEAISRFLKRAVKALNNSCSSAVDGKERMRDSVIRSRL